jgi:hypothetical protein
MTQILLSGFWSSRTDVSIKTPVAIADSMEPGEYQYGVAVYRQDHTGEETQAQFDLTITSS